MIHNHSLHHLPIAMAGTVSTPMLSTLHTPPTPWLESAIQVARILPGLVRRGQPPHRASMVAPSAGRARHPQRRRRRPLESPDAAAVRWCGSAVSHRRRERTWRSTRPSLAGRPLVLAGPVAHHGYYDAEIRPRLARPGIEHVGHLTHAALNRLVGEAAAALVTPCWDEPYGLVVAEALACGTPVCAFARGALPELLREDCGFLVAPGDVAGLARAIAATPRISRSAAREHAVRSCSLDRMVDQYAGLYESLTASAGAHDRLLHPPSRQRAPHARGDDRCAISAARS